MTFGLKQNLMVTCLEENIAWVIIIQLQMQTNYMQETPYKKCENHYLGELNLQCIEF